MIKTNSGNYQMSVNKWFWLILLLLVGQALAEEGRSREFFQVVYWPREGKNATDVAPNSATTSRSDSPYPGLVEDGKNVYLLMSHAAGWSGLINLDEPVTSYSMKREVTGNIVQYPLSGDTTQLYSSIEKTGGSELSWKKNKDDSYLIQAKEGKFAGWYLDFELPDERTIVTLRTTGGYTREAKNLSWIVKLSKEPSKMSYLYVVNRPSKKYPIAK